VIARYRGTVKRRYFRSDAAFANPEVYEFLEAEGMGYAIRRPANRALQEKTGYLLERPVGRPPHEVRLLLPASAIKRRAGRNLGGWWPRLSGTQASVIRASASSNPADQQRFRDGPAAFRSSD
jgi:hypothetical protein